MSKTLLIDGDVFVYQIGLAVEKATDWGDDIWTLHSDMGDARAAFASRMESLKDALEADKVMIALSCKTEDGFRRQLVNTYKANRAATRKPLVHAPLRQHLIDDWGAVMKPRLEADDVLGMWATEPGKEERIIVSVDKDFKGTPCSFYKLGVGGNHELSVISKAEADRWHALQTLMGDRVDGYYGVPGVGPKTAEKILGEPKANYWPVIKEAYKEAGLSEAVALQNARLAHILRHGEYDDKTNKLKLWTPKPVKSSPSQARQQSESQPQQKSS